MMTAGQLRLYRAEWGKVRKTLRAQGVEPARADQCRHEAHVQALGHDKSSLDFSNRDLDAVLRVFRSLSGTADFKAEMQLDRMPNERAIQYIRTLCGALVCTEDYAVSIARKMNREGRIGQPAAEDRAYVRDSEGNRVPFDYADTQDGSPRRKELILEDLDQAELHKIKIALKKQCRRVWPTKADLLSAIRLLMGESEAAGVSGGQAGDAVCAALGAKEAPDLDRLVYEDLLRVKAALHLLMAGRAEEVDQPF